MVSSFLGLLPSLVNMCGSVFNYIILRKTKITLKEEEKQLYNITKFLVNMCNCLKFATKPFRTRASRDGYNASQSSIIFGRGFLNCVCASFLATFELSGLHTCSG